jgi:2-polyprenyl-3-methyl-5-hydroxy-6-metoxy-1,4-benzoquinol methylase
MLTAKQKIKYFIDSFLATGQKPECPFCKNHDLKELDRKYLVTRLMECQTCHLYFRYPVDRKEENFEFYQKEYVEQDQIATVLPDEHALNDMIATNFSNTSKNGDRFLNLFARLFPAEKSLRIVDYGCSWGYLAYQFAKAGHEVQGYEISRSRALYGINWLNLQISTDENALTGNNQIFFSSHVIEHHPDISAMVKLAEKLLAPGGYFIAVSPNGSAAFRQKNPAAFHQAWGKVHPNYLNGDFYKYLFRDWSFYIGSSPFNMGNIHPLQKGDSRVDDLSGEELLVIAKFGESV